MKMKNIAVIIGIAVVALAGASVTVTQQNEYKLIRQFGKVDRVISEPGIRFKIPFIESTQSLHKEPLPDDNKAAVYERMISERDNIAATYTAEGNSEAKVIRNTTDKDVTIQISDAKKQAEILEAEGEQEYMKILAQAYGEEERSEFYSFVRSLDALKASMKGGNKTIILLSLRFLKENKRKNLASVWPDVYHKEYKE